MHVHVSLHVIYFFKSLDMDLYQGLTENGTGTAKARRSKIGNKKCLLKDIKPVKNDSIFHKSMKVSKTKWGNEVVK